MCCDGVLRLYLEESFDTKKERLKLLMYYLKFHVQKRAIIYKLECHTHTNRKIMKRVYL